MEISKKDKIRLKEKFDRYAEQRERIKDYEQNLEVIKTELENELDKLKMYRQEDFDLINELEVKYGIKITPEVLIKIIE